MISLAEWAAQVVRLRDNPRKAKDVAEYMLLWWTSPEVSRCPTTGMYVAYSSSIRDLLDMRQVQHSASTEGDAICGLMIELLARGAELRTHPPAYE